jgi:hypothetical protein
MNDSLEIEDDEVQVSHLEYIRLIQLVDPDGSPYSQGFTKETATNFLKPSTGERFPTYSHNNISDYLVPQVLNAFKCLDRRYAAKDMIE